MNKEHILENTKEGDCFKLVGSDTPAIATSSAIYPLSGLTIRTNMGLVPENQIESYMGVAWLCEYNKGREDESTFWFVADNNEEAARSKAEQILEAEGKDLIFSNFDLGKNFTRSSLKLSKYDGFLYYEYKSLDSNHLTRPTELFYDILDKGSFHISIDDWGGDYPGVDVEWVGKDKDADIVGNPRVLFEFPNGSKGPVIKVWGDTMDEDYTYKHRYDLSESEKDDLQESERDDR